MAYVFAKKPPYVPEPNCRGWFTDWMYGHSAPDAVLELLPCQCKRECLQEQCPCLDNGHKCKKKQYDSGCSYLDEVEY